LGGSTVWVSICNNFDSFCLITKYWNNNSSNRNVYKQTSLQFISFVIFITSYLVTAFIKNTEMIIAILSFLFLISFVFMPKKIAFKRCTFAMAIMLAIGGSIYEITLVKFSIFSYNVETIYGIPFWLPFLYINGAFVAISLGKSISANADNVYLMFCDDFFRSKLTEQK
jgi:hypothetical protein